MARNATPLLRAHPLPEMNGGVELLIVESRLAHPDPSGDSGYEEEHSLCVLCLISPTETERRWMRVETQRYTGAQASVVLVPGAAWAAGALQLLGELAPAFLDLVVGLPEHAASVEQQTAKLLYGLKAGHHQLCTAVAVAQHAAGWPETSPDVGLVVPHGIGITAGAIALHAGLAQMSAPQMIACATTEQVNEVVKSRARPATMYLTDDLGLPGAIAHGRSEHGLSSDLAAALFLDALTLHGYSAAARMLRAAGFDEAFVVAPHGLTIPSPTIASPRCVLVVGGSDDLPTSKNDQGGIHG